MNKKQQDSNGHNSHFPATPEIIRRFYQSARMNDHAGWGCHNGEIGERRG